MRTTVDLPADLHGAVKQLALTTHQSLSTTLVGLVARGLDAAGGAKEQLVLDPVSGMPTFSTGGLVTSEQVANLIDEDL
jgi:predicted transcriptional regulator